MSEYEYISDDDSPDLRAAIEESLRDITPHISSTNRASGSSVSTAAMPSPPPPARAGGHAWRSDTAALRSRELQSELTKVDAEIKRIDENIAFLQNARKEQLARKAEVRQQLESLAAGKGRSGKVSIDYFQPQKWTSEMKRQMREVFNIPSFRLAQEGVCNANMDGRDIVCVMPTGGGKSLTYQLPATLQDGCTLVISPLLALISDQVHHLKEKNIEAEMLTGTTSKAMQNEITQRLINLASGNQTSKPDLKLVYATPEKISKSKKFFSVLSSLAQANKLARVVIDEAHCVSQLGHDFRPDYRELSKIRTHFPDVPILALSATCPPAVLADILKVLQLKPTTPGTSANGTGTAHFVSPLYRKNLIYKVLEKSARGEQVVQSIVDYITKNHPKQSGIIYCFRKADAEKVAEQVRTCSKGEITTGVYHADIPNDAKERLHENWREGRVRVICATIAFGLGIDKADVRFVIHHSMSKTIENYYQESGRAGRDGKDADCVLFYRPQDAFAYADFIRDQNGIDKVEQMLHFCQDLQECRKIAFAKYFSEATDIAMSAWSEDGSDSLARCGHCDNCLRSPETVEERDVTDDAWRVVQIAETARKKKVDVTLSHLAATLRGTGMKERDNGLTGVSGISNISVKDAEALVVRLLLEKRLRQQYSSNAYSTNAYLVPGPYALPLIRNRLPSTNWLVQDRLKHVFQKTAKAVKGRPPAPARGDAGSASSSAPRKRKRKADVDNGDDGEDDGSSDGMPLAQRKPFSTRLPPPSPKASSSDLPVSKAKPESRPKRRRRAVIDDETDETEAEAEAEAEKLGGGALAAKLAQRQRNSDDGRDAAETDVEPDAWSTSMRDEPGQRRKSSSGQARSSGKSRDEETKKGRALKPQASMTGVRSMRVDEDVYELTDSD